MSGFRTWATQTLLILGLSCLQALAAPVQAQTFLDDFNRPDGPVGNGWSISPGNVGGNLEIRSNVLTTPLNTGGSAAIFRPADLSGSVSIAATITQENGFNGLLRRYSTHFVIGGNGTPNRGYELVFNRGDETYSDSAVSVYYNGALVGTVRSSFQFGAALAVSFSVARDGSISGSVAGDGLRFLFNFGPVAVTYDSANVAIRLDFPDTRTSLFTYPTVDNVLITSNVTEVACLNAPRLIVLDYAGGVGLYSLSKGPVTTTTSGAKTTDITLSAETASLAGSLGLTSPFWVTVKIDNTSGVTQIPLNIPAQFGFVTGDTPAKYGFTFCTAGTTTLNLLFDRKAKLMTVASVVFPVLFSPLPLSDVPDFLNAAMAIPKFAAVMNDLADLFGNKGNIPVLIRDIQALNHDASSMAALATVCATFKVTLLIDSAIAAPTWLKVIIAAFYSLEKAVVLFGVLNQNAGFNFLVNEQPLTLHVFAQ